jgi:hypothetical protein
LTQCVPPPDGTVCPVALRRLTPMTSAPQLAVRSKFQVPNASTRLAQRQA